MVPSGTPRVLPASLRQALAAAKKDQCSEKKKVKQGSIGYNWIVFSILNHSQHSALFSFLYVPDSKLSERHRLHSAGGYSHDGWQIKCEVDVSRTCQSLRTLRSQSKKVEEAAPTILRPLTVGRALKGMFNWDFSLL